MSSFGMRVLMGCAICFGFSTGFGQDSMATKAIAASVQLDSVVIVATRAGFSTEDFIRLVQTDESLYTAFRNLRTAAYSFDTHMSFSDKRDQIKASYFSSNVQHFDGRCRKMEVLDEGTSGDFYKGRKQKHRYYTYQLYARVFLTEGVICEEPGQRGAQHDEAAEPALERQVSELKKLIFQPGERSHVPLIGRKTEIFSEEMIEYYDFLISSGDYHGQPVYIFTAKVKDMYAHRENKTVFKELITWFSKADFQVVARKYSLSQKTAAFQFDVSMQVDLIKLGEKYFPTYVVYDGDWDIPTKKREIGTFAVRFRFD